jgi:hypothetical protein
MLGKSGAKFVKADLPDLGPNCDIPAAPFRDGLPRG